MFNYNNDDDRDIDEMVTHNDGGSEDGKIMMIEIKIFFDIIIFFRSIINTVLKNLKSSIVCKKPLKLH